ncbi:hypothetical protein CGCA056_v007441 [Colletotrichum aenigma]|uniref:uncharacterized protein n=1 Tax=Colletotrichum aenigma TaxID=1215731 RepID=UPI00187319D9|nr:uncharacterized protein CGCA056_v007441 [Colletotrichum aenigma]KAF5521154.1 hypothetical protein CGCA056_v007441 [Colletotrichum aenigma]
MGVSEGHTEYPLGAPVTFANRNLVGILTVAILAAVGVADLFGRASNAIQQQRTANDPVQTVHDCFRSCGYTAADSIERGCLFEEFDMRWEHPSCIDHELAAEYRRMGPEPDGSWTYMVDDETATDGVPINELRRRPVNATELSMLVWPGKAVYANMRHHLTQTASSVGANSSARPSRVQGGRASLGGRRTTSSIAWM